MNILLAVDSSDSSKAVIGEVLARPWPAWTRFCVIHVIDTAGPPLRSTQGRSPIGVQVQAGEELVASAGQRLWSRDLDAVTRVDRGHAASKIVEYSSQWNADFVIVGSQGRSGVKRFLLGSVAHNVIRHAPCSVEVVRVRTERPAFNRPGVRILLATDGSDYSRAAAQSVAERPWPPGTEIRLISVVHAVDPVFEQWKGAPEDIARIESESLSQGEEDLAISQRILVRAGLDPMAAVLRGYPKEVIIDDARAWDADLIVVGSHGRQGIARLLMGSVSEAVAMHAHCSVEVVRDSQQQSVTAT